jgi:hypothetical protein
LETNAEARLLSAYAPIFFRFSLYLALPPPLILRIR